MEEHERAEERLSRLYRAVWNNPPAPSDFYSWERSKGRPHPRLERRRLAQGVSTWRTLERTREAARNSGLQGPWIAEIELAKVRGVECEQTGDPDHFTLWADPQAFVDAKPMIFPISEG